MTVETSIAETMADLELALEDRGWDKLTTAANEEFSHAGLVRAARVCRAMAVANPLIRRGLNLRAAYVFGRGFQMSATTEGQDVSAVVHTWWTENSETLTGEVATEKLERVLGTDGNVIFVNFTNPYTGLVRVRTIPFDQITEKISNPDDATEPWFYRREHVVKTLRPAEDGLTTVLVDAARVTYHPDINYRPASRPRTIGGHEVRWDAPIHHVRVNDLDGWDFGIGDAYSAVTWARSYRDFLADWATLVKSLSQFAWRATAAGGKAAATRRALARVAANAPSDNQNSVGAAFTSPDDVKLEAIPKSGATIDSNSGRPLASMVAAALDIPVTVLLADPGVTGARATAETLDRPLYESMRTRQGVWADAFRVMASYAIREAVRAPQGPLTGTILRDRWTGRETVTLTGDTNPAVEIVFPELDDLPVEVLMNAIKIADDTGKVPPLVIARKLLEALHVADVDRVLEEMTDEDGAWLDPLMTADAASGRAAIDAYRAGQS